MIQEENLLFFHLLLLGTQLLCAKVAHMIVLNYQLRIIVLQQNHRVTKSFHLPVQLGDVLVHLR